jgi:hypothetical protein
MHVSNAPFVYLMINQKKTQHTSNATGPCSDIHRTKVQISLQAQARSLFGPITESATLNREMGVTHARGAG